MSASPPPPAQAAAAGLPPSLHVVRHPLVQHKVSRLRDRDLSSLSFRRLMYEVGLLLAYEVTRDLPLTTETVTTPLTTMAAPVAAQRLCLVSILRAGNGLVEPMLDVIQLARVGHIGLARDEHTLQPTQYLCRLPPDIAERMVVICDPMLATGNSAVAAIDLCRQAGASSLKFVCLLAAPKGACRLAAAHPDVPIIAATLDSHLDERGFIVPGLGDAGDRLYGT